MSQDLVGVPIKRRTILKAGLAIGAMQVASPFVVKSLADEPIKIGLDNPLTGTFAALGKNELIGAQLAVEQINAKGGILGRKVELLVEDSTSGDTATAVQKATQADRSRQGRLPASATSTRRWRRRWPIPASRRGVFHIVPGGHTDSRHRHAMPLERIPRLQHDAHGNQLGLQAAFVISTARSGTSSPPTTPSAMRLQAGFEASLKAGERHRARHRFHAARHHRLLGQSDQGAVRPIRTRSFCCSPATI